MTIRYSLWLLLFKMNATKKFLKLIMSSCANVFVAHASTKDVVRNACLINSVKQAI